MRLRKLVRKLKLGLAGLVGGFAFACSGPAPEAPPLAPRPEPMQPVPDQKKAPVPGAPDPLAPTKTGPTVTPDAGVTETSPKFESSHEMIPAQSTPPDAGVQDAVALPNEVPDALPPDASKRPESAGFACC